MSKIVLASDPTLSSEYRNFPLLDFLPCAPVRIIPGPVYNYLATPTPNENGVAHRAPYGLRKVEAGLLRTYPREDVVIAHPDYIEQFIDEETQIIGIDSMDPIGLGPLTMMFTNAGQEVSWAEKIFKDFIIRICKAKQRAGNHAKIVLGGAGSWEFAQRPEMVSKLGLDYIVSGEIDDVAPELFNAILHDSFGGKFFQGYPSYDESFHQTQVAHPNFVTRIGYPRIDQIPEIMNPSTHGLIECMRGCSRNCDFCEVTLRPLRYYPTEKVAREVELNVKNGIHKAWVHSDDIWVYRMENYKKKWPNTPAILELFETIMSVQGVKHCNPTHGTIAPPVADPTLIPCASRILRAGPENHIGIQMGLETGSDYLVQKHMPFKVLPLTVHTDPWTQIVEDSLRILNENYWIPAYTVIVGQEGETDDDNWETVGLLNHLSKKGYQFTATPMTFVPLGVLKGTNFYDVFNDLTDSQAAVIYAAWRNTKRMAMDNAYRMSKGDSFKKIINMILFGTGASLLLYAMERYFNSRGFNLSKAKTYTLYS